MVPSLFWNQIHRLWKPGKTLTQIFISYSHKDEKWKELLEKQLRVLQLEGAFEYWDDRQIQTGEDWFPEIEQALEKAEVIK